ncbi:MAG TPA: CAP domain-containing protein, partial [Candidatus Nitrosocosmicus sp.]|nr:CAP domain-containing protein [Candidatus Nitrosocosmicus sp.]
MNKFKHKLHNFFIPNEHNNYRSKALHLNFLSFYLVFAVLLSFIYKPLADVGKHVLGVATDITIPRLLELTNAQRQNNGLPPLRYNDKLSAAAMAKADNMFAKNYWSHYGPDGTTPWDFILGSGYRYQFAGENLAKDFMISDEVVQAWMDSPTHRENIVKRDYEEIGFGIKNGILEGEETTLVVQMFGKPMSAPVVAAIESKPANVAPSVPVATVIPTSIVTIVPTIPVTVAVSQKVPLVEQPKVLSGNNNNEEIVINKNKRFVPAYFLNGLSTKISFVFFSVL